MKRPSSDRLAWQRRRQRNLLRRQRRRSSGRRGERRRFAAHRASELLPSLAVVPKKLRYYARRELRREVEEFFEHVSKLLARGRSVSIDFSRVEMLYPCGVLILMGWVDEWTSTYSGQLTATYPGDDLVEQMLQHVGILSKLGLAPRKQVNHDDVTRWHYFHGRNADATPIEPFMLQLQEILGEEKQLGLGNCVTEAMINVRHHAYEGENGGPWWIFATVSKDRIFIALYDRGDSVPATLLSKPAVSDYLTGRMWSLGRGDGKLITAAVGGRTSTNLPYRGKGLPEMFEFTKSYPNSELGIFSRNGFFRYDGQQSTGRLVYPVKGTLVIWMLRLTEV